MLADVSLSKDSYGCDMIVVAKEHLEDFPTLISFIRDKGYGARTGVLKLRLPTNDREDARVMKDLAGILKEKFKEKIIDPTTKKKVFAFNPQVQHLFKASVSDDIYQYAADFCTVSERRNFIKEVTASASTVVDQMDIAECCKLSIKMGVNKVRKHCFEEIKKLATFTAELEEKLEKSQDILGTQNFTYNQTNDRSPRVYGAGLNVDVDLKIAGNFSLSNLNTITDLLDVRHDGIATPYAYCGSSHTVFPWHIEDGGLFSINYVIAGAPKVWFVIPPECFGTVDCIAQTFNIGNGHTSCRALLADHKILVADPEYFKEHHGIPYSTVIQETGDFIIVLPFALHSGMNLGCNYALAANFADEAWIEEGMYAPVCSCNPLQVHLELTPILKACKPELLHNYLQVHYSHPTIQEKCGDVLLTPKN